MSAARAWSVYEGSCSTLLPSPDTVTSFAQDRTALGLARIEAYYFAHNLFLPPEGLLGGMGQIGHLPGEIVQGRYDMICPARTAFELAAHWPGGAADDHTRCGAFGAGARRTAGAGLGGGAISHRSVIE